MAVSQFSEKTIEKKCNIPASRTEVWKAFTTSEGVESFFAPEAKIELEPGGMYEVYFLLDNPAGLRGSEGCEVLAFVEKEMLAFSWNAPPEFPTIRKERTFVVIFFEDADQDGGVDLRLVHGGWRTGSQWDEVFDYFDSAWDSVLESLKNRFANHHRPAVE